MALINSSILRNNLSRKFLCSVRNVLNQNTGFFSNSHRSYCSDPSVITFTMRYEPKEPKPESEPDKQPKLSKAAKSYLQRAQKYNETMSEARAEYNIGIRHLANMMGRDPNTFTQDDANTAIEYLFPSGIYDKRARPVLKPPEEIYPARKAPQFDMTGRPNYTLFYTNFPYFYQLCHDVSKNVRELDIHEDKMIREQKEPEPALTLELHSSEWLTKTGLENLIVETITDKQYEQYVTMFDRLVAHPYSYMIKDFIMSYRKMLSIQKERIMIAEPKTGEDGRQYVTTYECLRKKARGDVTVIYPGTGLITINGRDISFFEDKQNREQLLFPLLFSEMTDKVDIVANVEGGGPSGKSGAVRWGIAMGLRSFIDDEMIENMRIAGLLQRDYRKKERKKPGQKGARRKFTWKRH